MNTAACPKCKTDNLVSDAICVACGARLPWADLADSAARAQREKEEAQKALQAQPLPASPRIASSPASDFSALRVFGGLLLIGGLLTAGYYFFVFDTSVAVPSTSFMGQTIGGGRVNNLGLMSTRQNGIMLGGFSAVIGAILLAVESQKNRNA